MKMIGLDTNVLARYYIDDRADAEALRQRPMAQRLIDSGQPLFICKTVLLELEWLMLNTYQLERKEIITAFGHMLSLTNVTIEHRTAFAQALLNYQRGLSFSDALHHASYAHCDHMASFDDRRFARRVARLKLPPPVFVPR